MVEKTRSRQKDASPEVDWENYPAYQWFMKQVGGPDKMIPKRDGLSWILRIHYHEITGSDGPSLLMDRKVKSILKVIDGFYDFKKKNVKKYRTGDESTEHANPAHAFFTNTALGPKDVEEIKSVLNPQASFRELANLVLAREVSDKFLSPQN